MINTYMKTIISYLSPLIGLSLKPLFIFELDISPEPPSYKSNNDYKKLCYPLIKINIRKQTSSEPFTLKLLFHLSGDSQITPAD